MFFLSAPFPDLTIGTNRSRRRDMSTANVT